jgi:(2Fe-2S) ferredoxin
MARFRQHVFVCENERPPDNPKGCCAAKGSVAIRQALKNECDRRGLKGIVRVNKAGCLDQCAYGVTVVVYPEGIWYGGVKMEDVPAIAESLEKGTVVEGLRLPDEHLTGRFGGPFHSGNTPGGF